MWVPQLDRHAGPRYLAIAEAISEDLAEGRLKPGSRLPTHRELADQLGVTVGTVSRGYAEAARRGLLSGEVGRGTFLRQRAHEYSPLGAATEEAVVDLSLNYPPLVLSEPLRGAFERTLADVSRREDLPSLFAYPAEAGNARHREAGAEWIGRTGLAPRPEEVLVCSGSQHAIATLFATLLKPGDLVLTEALTYPGMKAAASLFYLRLQGVPTDGDGLRPDAFEYACRTAGAKALYCVPTIHNPTAGVMPEERRREIASIAEAHGVIIIEDDIHALLPEERPLPIAAFAPQTTYYFTGTSKTLAPGLRIGFILAPAGAVERVARGIRALTWSESPLMSEIAATWIRDGTAAAITAERRREAAARHAVAREILGSVQIDAHPSGHHLWLHLPEPWRSDSFAAAASRRGVKVTPSDAFVVDRGIAPHAVRVCLGAPASLQELRRGLGLLAETLAAGPTEGFPI
ncbi:MAG: PLP-dependent aminotransferase family protein [Vicinamibacteria bacterium]